MTDKSEFHSHTFSTPKRRDWHTDAYSMGTRILSPEIKRLEREAHHSPPSRAKVKNDCRYN